MSLPQLYIVLLVGGLVLFAGIAAVRAAGRLGLPSLLLFLALGVFLGEDGLGIPFDDAALAQTLGAGALAVILVEGGLSTRWNDIRRMLAPAGILATLGVVISVLVTAAGAHLLLGMEWRLALLLGAIVSSTDAAAVFSVLRGLPLPRRLAGLVEAESGFNDAPTVILVLVFSAAGALPSPLEIGGQMVYQIAVGILFGLLFGWGGAKGLRYVALPASGLYPLATLGLGITAFAAAGAAGASGIVAAYLSGIILGNSELPHRAATRSFAEGAAWLAQIGLFVMLGLLADPSDLPSALVPGLVVGLVLLLAARPISVVLCLLPFRMPWRSQAFISWAGLRGAVPIVLTTFPIVADVPGAWHVLNIVFVIVAVFTLIQAPSLTVVARRLGLAEDEQARQVGIESAPLDALGAELLTVTIPPGSRLHGVEVGELRLPAPSAIGLIVRDRRSSFVPTPDTRLREGDELLIVTTMAVREATERRLRAVSRGGRLARWFGDDGGPEPPKRTAAPLPATGSTATGRRGARPSDGRADQGRSRGTGHPPRLAAPPTPGERSPSPHIRPDGARGPHIPRPLSALPGPQRPNGAGTTPSAQGPAREENEPPARPAGHRPG